MDRNPYAAPDCGPPLAASTPDPALPCADAFEPLLLRAAIATIGGLVIGCLLVVTATVAWLAASSPAHLRLLVDEGGTVPEMLGFGLLIGGVPALMLGPPGYALLVRWGWANAFTVTLLGAAPGMVLLAFQARAASAFAVFGAVVALITHGLFRLAVRNARSTA